MHPLTDCMYASLKKVKYHGPWGPTTKNKWDEYVSGGCCMCGDPLQEADEHLIKWTHNGDPICNKCVDQYKVID